MAFSKYFMIFATAAVIATTSTAAATLDLAPAVADVVAISGLSYFCCHEIILYFIEQKKKHTKTTIKRIKNMA